MVCAGAIVPFVAYAHRLSEDERRSLHFYELERRWANELELRLLTEEQLKEGFRRERALRKENEFLRALLRKKRMEDSRLDAVVYRCPGHPEEW